MWSHFQADSFGNTPHPRPQQSPTEGFRHRGAPPSGGGGARCWNQEKRRTGRPTPRRPSLPPATSAPPPSASLPARKCWAAPPFFLLPHLPVPGFPSSGRSHSPKSSSQEGVKPKEPCPRFASHLLPSEPLSTLTGFFHTKVLAGNRPGFFEVDAPTGFFVPVSDTPSSTPSNTSTPSTNIFHHRFSFASSAFISYQPVESFPSCVLFHCPFRTV